jgi:plasmid maintenance system antidote protein VapI
MPRKKNTKDPRPTGKQIRKALIDIDQTPMDLAKAMGVSAYYIREIYAERRAARDMRKKIAAYLATQYRRYGYPVPNWAKIKKEQSA